MMVVGTETQWGPQAASIPLQRAYDFPNVPEFCIPLRKTGESTACLLGSWWGQVKHRLSVGPENRAPGDVWLYCWSSPDLSGRLWPSLDALHAPFSGTAVSEVLHPENPVQKQVGHQDMCDPISHKNPTEGPGAMTSSGSTGFKSGCLTPEPGQWWCRRRT